MEAERLKQRAQQSSARLTEHPTGQPMEVWATAKINLFLKVLDRRPDGYHTIETVYQSVGLADRLWFEASGEEIVLECRNNDLPVGKENLVVHAADLMRRTFPGRVKGIHIGLEKHIPVGGGLGGGSADAAATLRACNNLFELGLCAGELRDLASQIGMDVPFLIEGGRAVGRDRGERIEALEVRQGIWAVVAVPPVGISTRWAYERLDKSRPPELPSVEEFVERLSNECFDRWAEMCGNDFESVVFPAHPEIKQLRDRLVEAGCAGAFLTGSGSAIVGLTDDPRRAARVAREVGCLCRLAEAVPFLDSMEAQHLCPVAQAPNEGAR
jgi:4-diphosphocytidyl-2-C-methyl-D-erythritol kinase